MTSRTAAETFLAKHTPLKSFSAIEWMIKAVPFTDLKSLLQRQDCGLPSYFSVVQKKLLEVEGVLDKGQLYKVKLEDVWNEMSLEDYKDLLTRSISLYKMENFFKDKLKREVNELFISLNNNADVIASHKGMDESWVKSALSDIRREDRETRKSLKMLLNALTAYCCEHRLAYQ